MSTKVIKDHQFLHKGTNIEDIHKNFKQYKYKLMKGFLSFSGGYFKYLKPINMIKNYYGEKTAFYYAYMLHYQAFLIIPAFFGILVFINTCVQYYITKDLQASLDSKVNGIYGIAVPIWGAIFILSWERKQGGLQYVWNCSDKSHSIQDERENDFRFLRSFNAFTDQITKI
jgi:hypothetical protein